MSFSCFRVPLLSAIILTAQALSAMEAPNPNTMKQQPLFKSDNAVLSIGSDRHNCKFTWTGNSFKAICDKSSLTPGEAMAGKIFSKNSFNFISCTSGTGKNFLACQTSPGVFEGVRTAPDGQKEFFMISFDGATVKEWDKPSTIKTNKLETMLFSRGGKPGKYLLKWNGNEFYIVNRPRGTDSIEGRLFMRDGKNCIYMESRKKNKFMTLYRCVETGNLKFKGVSTSLDASRSSGFTIRLDQGKPDSDK